VRRDPRRAAGIGGGIPRRNTPARGGAGKPPRRMLVALVALLPLLALTVVGLTYAQWSETLDISATISTGSLDVDLKASETSDVTKSSQYIDVRLQATSTDSDSSNEHLSIIIEKAYPGAEVNVTFRLENVGTVPAKATLKLNKNAIPNDMGSCVSVSLYDSQGNELGTSHVTTLEPGEAEEFKLGIRIAKMCNNLGENQAIELNNIVTVNVEQNV